MQYDDMKLFIIYKCYGYGLIIGRIISHTSLFMCKIRVPPVSTAAVSVRHRKEVPHQPYLKNENENGDISGRDQTLDYITSYHRSASLILRLIGSSFNPWKIIGIRIQNLQRKSCP
eukprot:TRINITY_DN43056_c0_g1_i1.p1 TRINITY_DN43056_c0_g1~~TRINITY_DN43056_c0_g1_i1.p1  ORF type:complete len:116 (+),score=4.67 TRINITY_DN43056_c0_g1_i1:193-540(+)